MTGAWGSGPVDMTTRCRLDEPGRQVSIGSALGAAALAGFGLLVSLTQGNTKSGAEKTTEPEARLPTTSELVLPPRPATIK
jgi:hypothetical protein